MSGVSVAIAPGVDLSDLGERFTRARMIYKAISMLMADPPETEEESVREVAIIKASVDQDGFSWPEVLLAGLATSAEIWHKELTCVGEDEVEELFRQQVAPLRLLAKPDDDE